MRDQILLRQLQSLSLTAKVSMAEQRIMEWYKHFDGKVVISFSGGKDSTVLTHIVHSLYPDVPLVFANTGLEYPEIQAFAKKMGAEFVRPKMTFSEVISKYGYPIISKENAGTIYYARKIRKSTDSEQVEYDSGKQYKSEDGTWEKTSWKDWRRQSLLGVGHFSEGQSTLYNKKKWLPLAQETQFLIGNQCCDVMKKWPLDNHIKKTNSYPIVGTLAEESKMREQAWCRHGCNVFEGKHKMSSPMSFWKEQDVLKYIVLKGIDIASVYGNIVATDVSGMQYSPMPGVDCQLKCTGCSRTGCIFCMFGIHLEKGETRFQALARTHPKQYEYCMKGGQWVDNPKYDLTAPKYDGQWKNWNPKKIWVPSKDGLGMKHVIEECNQIYGKDFIRYE